jgi:hypothetical protein
LYVLRSDGRSSSEVRYTAPVVLLLHLLAAFAWGLIVQWPFGPWLFHAFAALAILHVLSPFWFHLTRIRPMHRAFLFGPFALAVLDGAFLVYAWRDELWRDLTVVFVPVLGGIAIVALLYALLVMSLLDRWRTRREAKRAK